MDLIEQFIPEVVEMFLRQVSNSCLQACDQVLQQSLKPRSMHLEEIFHLLLG
jgi:hypothetical protein